DIIIGAPGYNDWVEPKSVCGGIYVIYGSINLPAEIKFDTKWDIFIEGADVGDKIGYITISEDINLDGYCDILIDCRGGDGPNNERTPFGGEVYVIYGAPTLSSELDLTNEYDIVIYGAEAYDNCTSALAVGDIDGDMINDTIIGACTASGPDNTRYQCGEAYVIFGKTVLEDKLKLIDGSGAEKNICYSKYKPYTFQINVTDHNGLNDLENILLILDPNDKNLQYYWSRIDNEFITKRDPNNYTILSSESTAYNDGAKTWTLEFEIIFNWTYPDENLTNCKVNIESNSLVNKFIGNYFNIYKVENDLNFIGNTTANGEYQHELSKNDWVRGSEKIQWGGLKVVYEDTIDIYPPNDAFSVTIWDNEGDFWVDTASSGEDISITSTSDIQTDLNEIYTVNISDVPDYCDLSYVKFPLKIDADNATFDNSTPSPDIWFTSKNVSCSIEITDNGGSGVNSSLIDYSISIDNGVSWSEWLAPEIFEDIDKIVCSAEPTFDDGDSNLIRWCANDMVGNLNISNNYRISIDTVNVTFKNATPSENEWQPDPMVICNITIEDYHSGVDASSIEFSTSTSGIWSYGNWVSAKQTIDGIKVNVSVDPTFEEGDNNYIRWRAKDVAGNGPFVSEDYRTKVKLNHRPTSTLLLPENNSIIRTSLPELIWKGTDIDGDTPIYYNVYLSTDRNEVKAQDPSAHKTSNIINTRYKIESQLENGSTYYWTVIPNDGIEDGICESNIWQFQIDLSVEIPIVTLIAPINNSNITSTTPTLSWNVKYSNTNLLTYDIYLDYSSDPKNMTAKGFNEISYTLIKPLTPGKTYFWTVIPTAHTDQGKIQGICDSNIWNFRVETGFAHIYGVRIDLETQNLTVKQDGYICTNITITNIGNSVDMISLSLGEDVINANVALEHLDTPIRLNNNESIILELQILTFEDTKPGQYQLEITAVSNGALSAQEVVSDSKVVNIEVIQKEVSEDDGQQDANMMIIISLIIIIIITY
ncbi:MAG: hypothetical protein KAJ51_12480, partial [Thermoplasmata archaeon]|nr:hypothetical protein [Thermoplasmata archaeon]